MRSFFHRKLFDRLSLQGASPIHAKCDQPGSGSALRAYLDPDLVRVTRGELLFFAADVFFPLSVFLLLGLLDRWCFFGIGGPGALVPAVSAISSPNRAARLPSSSILAGLGAGCANVRSCPALASNSCSSTLRSTKRSSGRSSSLAPTPYRAAATCLHISAQSGQLQDNLISPGDGNKPSPSRQTRSMTPFDKRPCRSSTNESMVPAQSRQIAFQRTAVTGVITILTL